MLADKCKLKIGIPELSPRYERLTMFWADPRFVPTKISDTIPIEGKGGEFKTVIFEIRQQQQLIIITTQEQQTITLNFKKKYTFIFTLVSEPPTRTIRKYTVVINSWNDIYVNRNRWWHCKIYDGI